MKLISHKFHDDFPPALLDARIDNFLIITIFELQIFGKTQAFYIKDSQEVLVNETTDMMELLKNIVTLRMKICRDHQGELDPRVTRATEEEWAKGDYKE